MPILFMAGISDKLPPRIQLIETSDFLEYPPEETTCCAEQKQQQQLQKMRNSLRVGERIMTTGGIFGIIESISHDSVMVKVADKVKIEVAKNAIAGLREAAKKSKKT